MPSMYPAGATHQCWEGCVCVCVAVCVFRCGLGDKTEAGDWSALLTPHHPSDGKGDRPSKPQGQPLCRRRPGIFPHSPTPGTTGLLVSHTAGGWSQLLLFWGKKGFSFEIHQRLFFFFFFAGRREKRAESSAGWMGHRLGCPETLGQWLP